MLPNFIYCNARCSYLDSRSAEWRNAKCGEANYSLNFAWGSARVGSSLAGEYQTSVELTHSGKLSSLISAVENCKGFGQGAYTIKLYTVVIVAYRKKLERLPQPFTSILV